MRYTQQPYDPTANSGSIAELLMRSGQVQSEKLRDLAQIAATSQQQQGDAYSNLARNLGQIGTGAVGNYVDLRANEQKNKIAQQELAQRQQVNEANIAESQAATARTQALTAREQRADAEDVALKEKNRIATKIAAGLRDPDPQKREVVLGIIQDPETQDLARKMLLGRDKQNADYRAARAQFAAANGYDDDMVRIVVALDPMEGALAHFDKATQGGTNKAAVKQYVDAFWKKPVEPKFGAAAPGAQIYNEATGELGASVPAKPAVKPDFTLNGTRYSGETNQPMVTNKAPAAEGAHMWVLRDGKTIRIPESQYRQGDLPSNARTDLRPVTSGDAEDLAGYDTGLDDAKTLSAAISAEGATGLRAQLGASMPAWVTSVTGWGTDAKKKQALVDLVKQTIGKTLEGGVLRKEDEVKYAKILPTMADPTEVVVSKLTGLQAEITKRKQRRLDALDDSNYDVSKFRARQAGTTAADTTTRVYYDINGHKIEKP